jgi:CheY-like chemotaxis protein
LEPSQHFDTPERRILIADDHADSRELLAFSLRLSGYIARTAADGDEALRIAREFSPHVIFLDLWMPGLDGWEVCERLREQGTTRDVPVYALTASPDDGKLQLYGFTAYLAKPVELSTVHTLAGQAFGEAEPVDI